MRFVRALRGVRSKDADVVGAKNAMVGEMLAELAPAGIRVPDGFAITADAYREHLRQSSIERDLREALRGAHSGDVHDLVARSAHARDLVLGAPLPAEVAREVSVAYRAFCRAQGEPANEVAVRASATFPDCPDATFSALYESYLNVRGEFALAEAVRHVFASLFTPRALAERLDRGVDHLHVAMSVGIQAMVRSDLASAGVVYTADPETGDRDTLVVVSSWGLGESVAQERVVPDRFFVKRGTLDVVRSELGSKETKVVYDAHGHREVTTVAVPREDRGRLSLSHHDAVALAAQALVVERHFAKVTGEACAMDVEWAADGITGVLHLVQARREPASAKRFASVLRHEEASA